MSELTQHERDLRAIAAFKLFDDTFMSAVFDNMIPETELLLRTVLGREDMEVFISEAQFYLSNIYGHEVKLDIIARDRSGKAYNVEVQRLLAGASVKRARFNSAMVDVTLLKKGEPYEQLPERYTIFITEEDMFGQGLPSYHAHNKIDELDNQPLGDGGHILYINGQYRNTETPIGRLMHDFSCTNPEDMLTPLLKDRVKYLKETEGGKSQMCQIMEELVEERTKERIMESKIELAKAAIRDGVLSLEQIAKYFQLPLTTVQELEVLHHA